MIYFDNSATTAIKPKIVGETVAKVLTSGTYGNPGRDSSDYSVHSSDIVNHAREQFKTLFNVPSTDLVTFTTNATESLNTVLKGLLHSGDHAIATNYEHNSVIRPLEQLKADDGVEVSYLPFDPATGQLQVDQLEDMIKPNTKLIVCTHASNVTGYVLPIEKISKICQKHNLLLVIDAAQTAGFEDIDIQKMHIDALCFTGHKSLYGPQGTGGICLREPLEIEPLKSGGTGIDSFNTSMPKYYPTHLEAGTMNVPGIAGLSAGVQYVLDHGVKNIQSQVHHLTDLLQAGLKQYPEIKIYTPEDAETTGVVAFNVKGVDSADVGQWLWDEHQIATRSGAHCAPKVHQTFDTVSQGIVRLSLSSFNTEDEVDTFLQAIKNMMEEFRKES
ncbi:aminotransferase class V-fold PLP-dependent enzyme [Companilactobacillus mishanensis]|uniref:cysteine desulfurase n=1 Tax=Companilactobacillus mishanensis TaxID=2486008 RepID=A0A5P0ZH39_9LACO|nr:aminotransferase class V-fold PLP-dependent enzyme [Companilactobacillus mishanensis]MQS44941.1 aminotransferase class V-fold PLP-dependent enzyme [Companilactobacillus mishanensis]MQS52380.1 aminotransferase class V-fold PLP-dependent enzyme [Companilactobacillus mishanensis]MQS89456.1 aminotransferase class V-fold PLP-dependent enzyme [Companilactobacillus mishanensis]